MTTLKVRLERKTKALIAVDGKLFAAEYSSFNAVASRCEELLARALNDEELVVVQAMLNTEPTIRYLTIGPGYNISTHH